MKKVTLYLEDNDWRAFRVFCLETGTSASQEIGQFIKEKLEKVTQHSQRNRPTQKGRRHGDTDV